MVFEIGPVLRETVVAGRGKIGCKVILDGNITLSKYVR